MTIKPIKRCDGCGMPHPYHTGHCSSITAVASAGDTSVIDPAETPTLATAIGFGATVGPHPLQAVFDAVLQQCTKGKGVRHGGDTTGFLDQPWAHYHKLHGRGFLTGQAAKKLEEAASTRTGEAFIHEALGAIVYIGMAIIKEQDKVDADRAAFLSAE